MDNSNNIFKKLLSYYITGKTDLLTLGRKSVCLQESYPKDVSIIPFNNPEFPKHLKLKIFFGFMNNKSILMRTFVPCFSLDISDIVDELPKNIFKRCKYLINNILLLRRTDIVENYIRNAYNLYKISECEDSVEVHTWFLANGKNKNCYEIELSNGVLTIKNLIMFFEYTPEIKEYTMTISFKPYEEINPELSDEVLQQNTNALDRLRNYLKCNWEFTTDLFLKTYEFDINKFVKNLVNNQYFLR